MDKEKKTGGKLGRRTLLGLSLALVLIVALVIAGVGGAFALLKDSTSDITVEYTLATVDCEVSSMTDEGTRLTTYTVTNTGNTPAFLRAVVVMNWVDAEGAVIYDPEYGTPEPTFSEEWVNEKGFYYFNTAVNPGDSSVLFTVTIPEESIYKLQVTVLAEAIQSEPATASAEAWDYTPGSSR